MSCGTYIYCLLKLHSWDTDLLKLVLLEAIAKNVYYDLFVTSECKNNTNTVAVCENTLNIDLCGNIHSVDLCKNRRDVVQAKLHNKNTHKNIASIFLLHKNPPCISTM